MRYPSSPQTLQRILTQGKGAIYVPTLKKLSLFIPATCPARLNGVYFRVYALPRIYYHNKQMECRVILVHDAKPISSKSAPNTSKPHQVQQVPSESPVQATRITLEYNDGRTVDLDLRDTKHSDDIIDIIVSEFDKTLALSMGNKV